MTSKINKLISIAVILLTLAVVLFIGIQSGDFPASMRALFNMPPVYALAGVGCVFGGILMQTVSGQLALQKLNRRMSFPRLYAIMVLGEFYSFITPGASGGQPMQVFEFHRHGLPAGETMAALTQHFQCFQITLLILDVCLYAAHRDFLQAQLGANWPLLAIGFAFNAVQVCISLMIAFYQRPVRFLVQKGTALLRRLRIGNPDRLERLADGVADGYFSSMRALYADKSHLAAQFVCAVARLILMMSVTAFVYRGLGLSEVGYGKLFALGCMQYTSAAYTPLPGASGAQEGVFSLYFAGLLPGSLRLSGLLCWRFMTYYLVLIVGFFVTAALFNDTKLD